MLLLLLPRIGSSFPPVIRKNHVQSRSSSKFSWSVPGIKQSNKSDWHSPGSFLPTVSFWKVATLASICSRSRKDRYLDACSSGGQTRLLALPWLVLPDATAQLLWALESEVSRATYLALMSRAALSKVPWCQQLLVWVTLGVIIPLGPRIKSWLGQLYPDHFSPMNNGNYGAH